MPKFRNVLIGSISNCLRTNLKRNINGEKMTRPAIKAAMRNELGDLNAI